MITTYMTADKTQKKSRFNKKKNVIMGNKVMLL